MEQARGQFVTMSIVAIPKGRFREEGIAGKKTGSVEVVTTPGEHQDPENRHARYPGGRHYRHATLPHVILHQRENDQSLIVGTPSSALWIW